ncbi:hypothetical protein QMA60_08730 [Leuconostoc suionicum]|uniref:hypothetical protein n=1 Tax=Leuconostoc suionicum TaxID=1511761 RepID=UPI0024AE00AD|nr:hypothetical protein [Leuconostoc suionicum]MDI6498676.1 hypothetical protein [Leuconostoc suionicum]MDI6500718.1 hypothetical protein [Leuconostoc suionicum]MDI6502842.1 hypothetical protein [Leuconostoc suionicum]MDI6521968.1 hypothetical protein [Leuconostoc suionicum]MDI6550640.1 hypothetical protein [Leuconostoc suionicum]
MLKKMLISVATIGAVACVNLTAVHATAYFVNDIGSGYKEADVAALRNGAYTNNAVKVLGKTTKANGQVIITYNNGETVTVDNEGKLVSDNYNIRADTNYYFSTSGPYVAEATRGIPTLYTMDSTGSTKDNSLLPSGYYNVAINQNSQSGWRWLESGKLYTGFRYYLGAYYWFENGVRQDNKWETAWGNQYWVGNDGRAVQGIRQVDDFITADSSTYDKKVDVNNTLTAGTWIDFGNNGTFNFKNVLQGYIYTPNLSTLNGGYNWFENGKPYTGFRYYMGTYYWFVNGVRQNEGWRYAWGYTYYTDANGRAVQGTKTIDGITYYFGNNGTYYLRDK